MNEIFQFLYESSIVFNILYIAYRLIAFKLVSFNTTRFILLLIGAFSFSIPFININYSPDINSNKAIIYAIETINISELSVHDTTKNWTWQHAIMLIYMIGLCFHTIRLLFQTNTLIKLIKRGKTTIKGKYVLVELSQNLNPFSFYKYIFYNPEKIKDKSDLDIIINHEINHVKQHHYVDLTISEIACAVQWFNPLIWLWKKSITENHEYLTDHKLVSSGTDFNKYQKLLLTLSMSKQFCFANNFNKSLTLKRLETMKRKSSNLKELSKLLLLLPVSAIVLFLFSCDQSLLEGEKSTDIEKKAIIAIDNPNNEPYFKVDEMPEFPGGQPALIKYIATYVKYPKEARQAEIAGKVYVTFVVAKNGEVKDVKIARGVAKPLDEEAIRIISSLPKWTPGKHRGEAVDVAYTIPINFQLQ